jgi:hypothetical protein
LRKYAHSDDTAKPFLDLDILIDHIYGKEDEYVEMQQTNDTRGRLAHIDHHAEHAPHSHPQENLEESDLVTYYNQFNKKGMCPIPTHHLKKHSHMFKSYTENEDKSTIVCTTIDFHPYVLEGYCRVIAPKVSETLMFVCRGHDGSATQSILVDTGASHSVISERAAQASKLAMHHGGKISILQSVGSHTLAIQGTTYSNLHIGEYRIKSPNNPCW